MGWNLIPSIERCLYIILPVLIHILRYRDFETWSAKCPVSYGPTHHPTVWRGPVKVKDWTAPANYFRRPRRRHIVWFLMILRLLVNGTNKTDLFG